MDARTKEAFAAGYKKAQEDAAYLFGALNYEQANKDMLRRAQRLIDEAINAAQSN